MCAARRAATVVLALIAGACAPSQSDMKPPYYSVHALAMGGNCTGSDVVDVQGIKVRESGCEERSSGTKVTQISEAGVREIRAAFAAIPVPPDGRKLDCEGRTISIGGGPEPLRSWRLCEGEPEPPWFTRVIHAIANAR